MGPVCGVCSAGFYPWGERRACAANAIRAVTARAHTLRAPRAGHECKQCTNHFRWVMPVVGFIGAVCFFAGARPACVSPFAPCCLADTCAEPSFATTALFLLPIRPGDPEPAVRVKIAMTLLQARVPHALHTSTCA
jgi:hypothetical protein